MLIAGAGYVGGELALRLAGEGHQVWAMRRTPPASGRAPVKTITADLTQPDSLRLPPRLDVVVYAAAADRSEDDAYRSAYVVGVRNLLGALGDRGVWPRRFVFVSSTSVYAQTRGEWVDEDSPTEPTHFTGRRMREGERLALGGPFAATVVRFGGIYGPTRTRLIDLVASGSARERAGPPVYANRIHRDDAVGVLRHVASLREPMPVYVGTDSEPADVNDVYRWIAARLGVELPAAAPEAARSLRSGGSNKRCRNARLLASGYTFLYPTFREGYAAMLGKAGS